MLSLSLLFGVQALALQPTDSIYIGQEPVRLRRVHIEKQHDFRHTNAWERFEKTHGDGWNVIFDEKTGTPHRLWGAGIELADVTDDAAVAASITAVLERHEGLLQVPVETLRLGHSSYDAVKNRWFVRLDQTIPGDAQVWGAENGTLEHFASHGAPVVWRGAVEAWVQHGRLTMVGMDVYPGALSVSPSPSINADEAIALAIDKGPAPDQRHDIDGAALVVLPVEVAGGLEHHLTWLVRTRTGDINSGVLPGHWVSFIDAHTGALLNVHNQVRYLDGTLNGRHDTRTVDGDVSESPLPYVYVDGDDGSTATTDTGGGISIDGARSFSADLNGEYFRVRSASGDDGALEWAGGDGLFTEEDATIAEIDSYVFLSQIREWSAEYAWDIPLTNSKVQSTVNIDDSCNAYYDGSVNFFRKGGGCNNTGRIADVNYHEWGHGFHYSAADSYYLDGAVGEGAGDTIAVMNTGDPVMAPYFLESGGGIREVATNKRYPDDVQGQVHADGLIFGGAMWDTWAELREALGDEEGYAVVARLFAEGLQFNPELVETYDAMVVADDDNGDLSDGTPNQCALLDGFAPHGLGPGGASSVLGLSHMVIDNTEPSDQGYPVEADLINLAPECVDVSVASARAVYSVDGGETWLDAELSAADDLVQGEIPPSEDGSLVHYYLELESADGTVVRAPQGGSINPTTFVIGTLNEVYFEDFEDSDGDYTHELVRGEETEGADDWQWGTPVGLGGDPDFAYSGSKVWGNDLGGEWDGNQYNGEYQNDKVNRLTSPTIEVPTEGDIVLQFRRWLNVEDGYYDQARVTVDGEELWNNHATSRNIGDEHHKDAQWALETVRIPAELIEDGEIEISWSLHSDAGLSFGGWTLDDVAVYEIIPSASADEGQGDGLPAADSDGAEISACACAASTQSSGGLAILGLLGTMLLVRRRESETNTLA